MTWITPSTAPSDGRLDYQTWVDDVVLNVNELYHRKADSLGAHLEAASSAEVAKNVALVRQMRTVEIGGIDDWTSLDTIEGDAVTSPAGGGPGVAFTIPKGMSGLWRFTGVGGSTSSTDCTVQLMWSHNSTQTSTGFEAMTTAPANWTYQWCMGSMASYQCTNIAPAGLVIDRFSSGDKVRFYTVARMPSGSTTTITHGDRSGIFARLWAQFLGTTA